MRLIPIAAASFAVLASAHAQTLVRSVNGPAAGAQFGKASIVVPDQNADGYEDVLVGAPKFNGARGAIYCISGAFLATGGGAQTLWSIAPPAAAGDEFGFALADVGDVTGDGVHDFLVGQPGYDLSTQTDVGAVRLVHGSSHVILSLITGGGSGCCERVGFSIAACGDMNLNGFPDVAVGSPGAGVGQGAVRILDGFALSQVGSAQGLAFASFSSGYYSDNVGFSVASGVDLTGDGIAEVVAGVPGFDNGAAYDCGRVIVYDAVANQQISVASAIAGELFGSSVSMAHDYDGDGVADIVVGAPNSPNGTQFEVGRVSVLSGANVVAQSGLYEIYGFAFGSPSAPVNHSDPEPDFHFGAAVRACGDLDNDGVGEILIGAPGYFTQGFPSGWSFRGYTTVISGSTGEQLCSVVGSSTDRLGDTLAGAIDDLNGDGFAEFVLAGSLSDAGGTDSGVLKCYRLFPVPPASYCTGKVNSLGCTPFVSFSGAPSMSSGQPFLVNASNLINQKNGLLFYSRAAAAVPFQGGTKCVASPSTRTPVQNSGGATSGASCSGVFSFDFNAWIASGTDASLAGGQTIYAQYWSRDPAMPSTTSLSNALRFLIAP